MLRGKRRLYRQGGLVRGNVVIILGNLEILDIVEFLIIFITRGLGEFISAGCQIFYPVAFFLWAFKGSRCYNAIIRAL